LELCGGPRRPVDWSPPEEVAAVEKPSAGYVLELVNRFAPLVR
jgi:hypothetical protein